MSRRMIGASTRIPGVVTPGATMFLSVEQQLIAGTATMLPPIVPSYIAITRSSTTNVAAEKTFSSGCGWMANGKSR